MPVRLLFCSAVTEVKPGGEILISAFGAVDESDFFFYVLPTVELKAITALS